MSQINFLWPLSGGLLIGLSAALYLLLNGRVAGISGLTASAIGLTDAGISWLGVGFIGGILAGAALASALIRQPELTITASPVLLIAGGLIVGFGTRLGSGCTSGHGVCGLARLSPRSMIATATFMAVAALTVFVVRILFGGGA
ncbi:YeeE/YedE family protein [Rhizobium herbae]